MTIAEKISALLSDDGSKWETVDGRTFLNLIEEYHANGETHPTEPYLVRYVFADGSAIVTSENCWDIEGEEPWSWQGLQ